MINNRQYMAQIINFDGLTFATDADCCMELDDKLFVFAEVKHGNAPIPTGQRLFLERTVDAIKDGGRVATACHVTHNTSGDIILRDCAVVKYYWDRKWVEPKTPINYLEFQKKLIGIYVPNKLKEM